MAPRDTVRNRDPYRGLKKEERAGARIIIKNFFNTTSGMSGIRLPLARPGQRAFTPGLLR